MEKLSREKIFTDVAKKILLYSSETESNPTKLVKYLSLIRQQQLNLTGIVEKKVRRLGVIEALIHYLSRQVDANENTVNNKSSGSDESTKSTVTTGLSILGNAFAVDAESRRQADKLKFVLTLKCFLQSTRLSSNADIISRVLKRLANLGVNDQLRCFILREGIGICIVNRIEEIYTRLTNAVDVGSKINEIIIEKGDQSILCQAVRAIRIFSSDFEFQQHLLRFGALTAVGRFLRFSHNQILFADILKSLAVLTTSMKKVPRDVLEALTESSQKSIPQQIILILKSHHSTKCLAEPATVCLTQFACNIILAKALINSNIFEVVLHAIKQTDDIDRLEKLLRLLVVLTQESPASMDSNLSRLSLSCCSQLGETLKVLQMPELKHYHTWILKLYENLYEDTLKGLISRGIITVLDEYLREKLGDFSFENLSKKLASRDDDSCHVHTTKDLKCPFSPKYRCTSPSWIYYRNGHQVQDAERSNSTKAFETPSVLSTFELNTLSSPYSSPPQSPTCDYADRYTYFGTYSPSTSSPTYSRQFQFSPESSSGSDDEGIGSSSTISPYESPTTLHNNTSYSPNDGQGDTEYSEDECEDAEEVKMEIENVDSNTENRTDDAEPPTKKLKYDGGKQNYDDNNGATTEEIMNIDKEEDDEVKKIDESLLKSDNLSIEKIRHRYSKIVSILGILNRCAHFTSAIPADLTKFLPFLFEVIWSTRMSVEKGEDNSQKLENADELLSLGSLCFQRSFKIVTKICSDITTFPNLVENGVIPLVYRILLYNFRVSNEIQIAHNRNQYHRMNPYSNNQQQSSQTTVTEFINDYGMKLMDTLVGMSGSENESIGWRQYYFLRWLVPGQKQSSGNNYANAILSIPLLYCSKSQIYREFEEKTGNWEKIFELLTNVDEMQFSQFQNCILALMCIGQAKGLKWCDAENASKKKLLYPVTSILSNPSTSDTSSSAADDSQMVVFDLDDGSTMTLEKKYLTEASPVFDRMLNGHFREAGQQRVNLRRTSRSALNALAMQIQQQSLTEKINNDNSTTTLTEDNNLQIIPSEKVNYELGTLFELLSLCDQFLLDNLYERTLNTLIGFYICPFSVPTIYAESLTFGGLHKTDTQLSSAKNLNLTRLALKYLLVGEDICLTLRSGAFWKIFDMTLPSVVVQDLREILNFHAIN